jgi:hypothetical protein
MPSVTASAPISMQAPTTSASRRSGTTRSATCDASRPPFATSDLTVSADASLLGEVG